MGLNNIELSPIALHELFRYSLLEWEDDIFEKPKQNSSFSTLGNNKKNILIIIESDEVYLPDDELNFLLGILSACQLSMEDVAILNLKRHKKASYKSITTELRPEKLFLFGVLPSHISLPLDFPHYQIQRYNNQTYLAAPLLLKLQQDKSEKTRLWNSLKEIFSI